MRTLQDSGLGALRLTAFIAFELVRYYIDIAAFTDTRLPEDSLVEVGTGNILFAVAYPKMSIAFMVVDLQLGLRFCGRSQNLPLQ